MQTSRSTMGKQIYRPKGVGTHNTALVSTIGVDQPGGINYRQGKDWIRHQVCRRETFALFAVEKYHAEADDISFTNQEDYVKINFWLSGAHTTVLDGFGQHDHDRPEIYMTSGPREMVKVDMLKGGIRFASVALCLRRDFFPVHMGLQPDELPEPLRTMILPEIKPYAFHQFPFRADLVAAARAILAAPFSVRRELLYGQAKAVELMCLLIDLMTSEGKLPAGSANVRSRQQSRLYDARELLHLRYAEAMTLERISAEVGLNRMALTTGFRQLFGMSVYDCLQKERMERAYELLKDENHSVTRIAKAVGYAHSCNFSTAFHGYFGCTPQKVRGNLR